MELSYDFDKKQATQTAPPSAGSFRYEQADGSWEKDSTMDSPMQLYTAQVYQLFLLSNLRYPAEAIDKDIQGIPIIAILIDENGNAISYEVAKSAHPLLDQEALRVLQLFDPEFVPAERNGKRIRFKFHLPIVFRMEK